MPARPKQFDFDVAILGGGSAGYAAARTAAAAGLRTVALDGAAKLGGLCILQGCMPSKTLLHTAEVLHTARSAVLWGLRVPRADFDFAAVMARKDRLIAEFARYRQKELKGGKFKFLRARARFVDAHTVELTPRGARRATGCLTARHFVIATGSAPPAPPSPMLTEIGYLTSDEALNLRRPPKSLIVLGGGPVGLELGQFFRRMDTEVTLIQRGEHVLRDFDIDAADAVTGALRKEGMRIFANTKVMESFRSGTRKGIVFRQENRTRRVTAEAILLATGRAPNTAGLGLEEIGVTLEYGRIVTNAEMQTSLPHIYAAGDCTGPNQIVHMGVEQGEIAAHNIAHPERRRHVDYRLLTMVVFTSPQAAFVGLTEKSASARGVPFFAASHPFNDHGKSLIMEEKQGFVKLLADPVTGEILGGACVGPMGGELLHEIIAAMHKRMTAHELAAMPHYHPTLSEIWTYPAGELAEKIPAPGR